MHQAQQRTEPRALFIWAPMRLADREMAPFRTPITPLLSHDGSSKSAVCVLSLPGSHHNTVQEAPSDGQMHLLGIPVGAGLLGSAGMSLLVSCRKLVSVIVGRRYRPELHYMRGPGPKWLERHGRSSARSTALNFGGVRTPSRSYLLFGAGRRNRDAQTRTVFGRSS